MAATDKQRAFGNDFLRNQKLLEARKTRRKLNESIARQNVLTDPIYHQARLERQRKNSLKSYHKLKEKFDF